jgi:hypothetical protein
VCCFEERKQVPLVVIEDDEKGWRELNPGRGRWKMVEGGNHHK